MKSADSRIGPHHPSFEWDVRGQDEVILSWLDRAESTILMPVGVAGRYVVRSADRRTVAEIDKQSHRPVRVALAAGAYEILKIAGGKTGRARVEVRPGDELDWDEASLVLLPAEELLRKAPGAEWALSVAYELRSGYLVDAGPAHHGRFAVHLDLAPWSFGLAVSAGRAGWLRHDLVGVDLTEVELRAQVGVGTWLGPTFWVGFGAETGVGLALQDARFGPVEESNTGFFVPAEGLAIGRAELGGGFALRIEGHGGLLWYGAGEAALGLVGGARVGVEVSL